MDRFLSRVLAPWSRNIPGSLATRSARLAASRRACAGLRQTTYRWETTLPSGFSSLHHHLLHLQLRLFLLHLPVPLLLAGRPRDDLERFVVLQHPVLDFAVRRNPVPRMYSQPIASSFPSTLRLIIPASATTHTRSIPKRSSSRRATRARVVTSFVLPGHTSEHTGRPSRSRTIPRTNCLQSGRWSLLKPRSPRCSPPSPVKTPRWCRRRRAPVGRTGFAAGRRAALRADP